MTTQAPDELRFEVTQEHFQEASRLWFKHENETPDQRNCLLGVALRSAGYKPMSVGFSLFRIETEPGLSVTYFHPEKGLVNRFCFRKDITAELPLLVVAKKRANQ